MKHISFLSLLLVLLVTNGSKCKKNGGDLPQLPPETQTGANTFGCLVDGKVFLPKGDPFGGPIKKAQYQFVNGKQGFGISARRSDGETGKVVGIIGDSIKISIGTFNLTSLASGKFRGGYTYSDLTNPSGISYYTNEIQTGQITIKNFDTINQIVSGTFWFDALDNTTGKIVQIREGRFDMPYVL
jgi:hypothetical protein